MIQEWGAPPRQRRSSTRQSGRTIPGGPAKDGGVGRAVMRQRVTAALGASSAGSSWRRLRRSARQGTPPASAASCRRREVVRPKPRAAAISPTAAPIPRVRSASSSTISTRSGGPASA